MKPFIGYHFFHHCGRLDAREAYSSTEHAMTAFTDQKAPSVRFIALDLRDDSGGPLESLYRDPCRRFGQVSGTMKGISATGEPEFRAHRWILSAEQFEASFSLLRDLYREIPLSKERLDLRASWSFKFIEPETGAVLPGQESLPEIDIRLGPGSSLNLSTGARISANAWFLFPFESASAEFEHYACRFQKEMIFKFSPKHWRLWNHYPKRGWWPKKFVPSWYGPRPS